MYDSAYVRRNSHKFGIDASERLHLLAPTTRLSRQPRNIIIRPFAVGIVLG
jgi:hypothetical protein